MAKSNPGKKAIIIALIGVAGSLLVAIINKWDFSSQDSPATESTVSPKEGGVKTTLHDKENKPLATQPISNPNSERIRQLVHEAKSIKHISNERALEKYKEAYQLLPQQRKPPGFIGRVENTNDFKTQVQLLDSFFNRLNHP